MAAYVLDSLDCAWLRMYLTHLVVVSINTEGCEHEFLSSHHLVNLPSHSLNPLPTQVASGRYLGGYLSLSLSLHFQTDYLLTYCSLW